uniref:Uncharacterized protein n=1 Tax=Alexandrium andersonii TaxID=327968 RepID=A0A7S2ADG5_9DINO
MSLDKYKQLGEPKNYEEQCERNRLRSTVREAVLDIMNALDRIHQVSGEPGSELQRSESPVVKQVDDTVQRFSSLQNGMTELFRDLHGRVRAGLSATSAKLIDLQPHIQRMDSFMQLMTQELENEAAQAREIHSKRLEDLRSEEARYVRANDEPGKNPVYAKTVEDIESTERALMDTDRKELDQKDFHDRWLRLMAQMPNSGDSPGNISSEAVLPEAPSKKRKWGWW